MKQSRIRELENYSLAALLIASATFSACSGDDNIIDEQPADKHVYIMTVEASKGDDTANSRTNRALSLEDKTLNAAWTAGDKVEVWSSDGITTKYGELTASTSGANTTLSGNLEKNPQNNETLLLKYLSPAYSAQDGTLTGSANSIDKVCDYATATVTADVDGDKVTATDASFANQQAIVKFTLIDKADSTTKSPTTFILSDGTTTTRLTGIPATTYTANSDGVIYVALPGFSNKTVTLNATVGTSSYTYSKDNVTFENGQYYAITVKMVAGQAHTKLSEATTVDIGRVVCAAGELHDAKTAVPSGCTAVGILGSISSTGHGLILALQDATSQTWTTINGWSSVTAYASTTLKVLSEAGRGSLTSYTTLGSTAVSNWAVAQRPDYQTIFQNLGSTSCDDDGYTYDENVNAYLTIGVGGTALENFYWSATECSTDNAWHFYASYWIDYSKTSSFKVRPVLGF